ncbi:hypothetical protein K7H91_02205 [Martelella mediterranea]|uniref:hypothetical protein n=1 Tax=Martelella mediterranea TaxID=293089 RepID=UPI001E519587|nr:hypothetical protein [Martelella mediterranea]MCD1632564.1 hypothetical protein [Martelella mediterranea]
MDAALQVMPLADVASPQGRAAVRFQHAINNTFLTEEEDCTGPRCFASSLDVLDVNHKAGNWLMLLEWKCRFQIRNKFV